MKKETYSIEIITPCFCAGADQSKAEIRAASIRGQLRWWFRLIDHDPANEATIFGSLAGGDDCAAAALAVRVVGFKPSGLWRVPEINQNNPENYVWHYASVSGTTQKGKKGPRWKPQGAIAPQSTFSLQLLWRRKLTPELQARFDLALKSFLTLGTLGLRSTRGLGALHCAKFSDARIVEEALAKLGFTLRWREKSEGFPSYESALRDYASWLRYDFRKQFKADRSSPLGTSTPRQSSALRFRCFKRTDGKFGWLAYEAPHSRVLGQASRRSAPLLAKKTFTGVAPTASPTKSRY